MNNRKYYAFERNNYYYGKLLTSGDFQSEQNYMNDKRRLLSRTLHGAGVVYGMGVVSADDTSVILQSGLALDGAGREITVSKTQVLKLSTIAGCESLKTDVAVLGIRYNEENADPAYAVMGNGQGSEQYNRVKEGYSLFLQDERDAVVPSRSIDNYLITKVIYSDADVEATITMPSFVLPGKGLKIVLKLRKTSHAPSIFTVNARVDGEKFRERRASLALNNVSLEYGESTTVSAQLHPENYVFGDGDVVVGINNIELVKSGVKNAVENQDISLTPVTSSIMDYVRKNSYKGTMDVDLDACFDEKLYIARIHLIRSENRVLIDQVENMPYDQYVCTADQLQVMQQLEDYMMDENAAVSVADSSAAPVAAPAAAPSAAVGKRLNSSGVFEMTLGGSADAGKTYFSEEIMHGLGEGPVYVEIGIEYVTRGVANGQEKESIILGDGSIFAQDETISDDKVLQVDQAIRILPDRGTFIVGVRPKMKMSKIGLRIRWYAFKPEDLEQRVYTQKQQKGCVMIQPDTIVVQPKSSTHIEPVFINMPQEALTFSLLDPDGGRIDNNGLYTAPAQEGVYEIRVEAISNPDVFCHAFIIVSNKKSE